jgi:multidrug resistance efflux pump
VRQEKFKVSVVGNTTRVEKTYGQSKKNEIWSGKCLGDAEKYKHRFEEIEASLVKNEAPLGNFNASNIKSEALLENFESDALKKANAPARRSNAAAQRADAPVSGRSRTDCGASPTLK